MVEAHLVGRVEDDAKGVVRLLNRSKGCDSEPVAPVPPGRADVHFHPVAPLDLDLELLLQGGPSGLRRLVVVGPSGLLGPPVLPVHVGLCAPLILV